MVTGPVESERTLEPERAGKASSLSEKPEARVTALENDRPVNWLVTASPSVSASKLAVVWASTGAAVRAQKKSEVAVVFRRDGTHPSRFRQYSYVRLVFARQRKTRSME